MVRSLNALEAEYRRVTPKSRAQWERGRLIMPGGVIKGAYWSSPYPMYVDRAQDCYLWDLDGRKYVDFANHHTSMILGHNHPAVVKAVQEAIQMGIGLSAPTTFEAEMAEELVERFPSIEKIRFTNSGTESSLHATRLVRAATGKPKVAKFEGAYHGSHDSLEVSVEPPISQAGAFDSPRSVAAWKGMARGSEEDVVVLPYDQMESVELILREHQDEVAAVFYDGKPGLYSSNADFAHFVRGITRELDMLMVMDEIVSFRASYSGYQGIVGVKPDLTILGKIVGGGFPVGAIGGRADLMDMLDNTQSDAILYQSGTFSGNHFTLAAGLATLRELTPQKYEHLDALRIRFHDGLVEIFDRVNIPSQVISKGSIVNVYLTDQPVNDYRSAASLPDLALFNRIILALLLRGYHVGPGGGMGFVLSTPMGIEHIDGVLEALERVLEEEGE